MAATRWATGLIVSLAILGVAGTGFAYSVWFALLRYLGLVVLGGALLLVPVVGVVVAYLSGERPTTAGSIGALVTLIGTGLITRGTTSDQGRPAIGGKSTSR